MAFVSTPSTSNNDDVSTVIGVSTASPHVSTANLSDATVVPRNQENRTRNQETTRRTVNMEDTSFKVMVAIDGAGFDCSYMADDEAPTNMAFMDFLDSEARCKYHQRDRMVNGTNHARVNHSANTVPKAVLTIIGLKPVNYVRHVNPKSTRRSFQKRTSYNNINFSQKVNTAKGKVNTARPNSAVLKVVRENKGKAIKASACWVWRPIKLDSALIVLKKHTYIDARGRSKSEVYPTSLTFKEFDGGYKAFGGGVKGGKITGKGIIRTSKLDFEDVYFIKELQFNLFSVSQMCDKKNSVLFTNTECFVLSHDFKLADESHVLLKVPRKNNMYSVDMKKIVPKKDLICLIAKATNDESMLWHRRLGHINFKNINKLVKENLVRATKDETSRVFKSFITEIENLVGKKVKIISCDNGTEYKNSVMNKLCEEKDSKLPTTLWAEAVNTACYMQNRVLAVKPHLKTPYELLRGRTHALSFMRPFGCHVTILNTLDHLGKFDGKSDEGFFVGYSTNSKAFKVYNTRTRKVEENMHINFLENKHIIVSDGLKWLFDIDALTKSMKSVPVIA
nr:ribonuclease H-like domain-containing protein [Tanacetum cinerariifolium]